jgi:hypothetical protein
LSPAFPQLAEPLELLAAHAGNIGEILDLSLKQLPHISIVPEKSAGA